MELLQSNQDSYTKHLMDRMWRIWAKALGQKASDCDVESDRVAVIRSVIALINIVTCIVIITNAVHHW